MNKFLKENWFKLGAVFIILISIGLVTFFYEKQLALSATRQNELMTQKCSEEGKDFYTNEPSFQYFRSHLSESKALWGPPEYHFNTKLQTCLMSWETTGNLAGYEYKTGGVVDVVANKTILKSDSNPLNYDVYLSERNILMSE